MNSQVDDCSGFEDLIKTACSSLSTTSKPCYYDGTQCREWYTDCADYTPTGNDDKICSQIIPTKETDDSYKKCVIGTNNGNTVCKKVYKTCEDLTEWQCKTFSRTDLDLGSDKRCLFVDNKCETHYDSCTNTELNGSDKCNKNIPSTISKRCKWSGSSCAEENRKCVDYIVYSGNGGESNQQCYLLEHTSHKVCFFNGENCVETYKACEDYVSTDQSIQCNKIRPLTESPSTNGLYESEDLLYKCVTSDAGCKKELRTCEEYNEEEYEEDNCPSLKSTKDPSKSKAECVLEDGHCYDRYKKCEDFNDFITSKDDRNTKRSDCTSIKAKNPDYGHVDSHYKCSIKENDNNKCATEKKACSEITDESICNTHKLDDENKKCIYKDNACKEEYKNCDTYNNNHGTTPLDETTCKAITPKYDGDSKVYQCVYKETSGNKKCEKEEMKCENYSGQDKDYCESITANDTSKYQCAMVNNHCVTQYKSCSLYNSYITSNPTKIDKSICESIVLSSDYKRCFLEDDKRCVETNKLCSEYEGDDEYTCTKNYRSLDSDKICAIENNRCVEKYPSKSDFYYYYFCSEYKGTNKEFCEAIQPYTPSTSTYTISSTSRYYPVQPDYSAKCVYGEYGCEKKQKKCEEASNEVECGYISPEDTNKICVFKSNRCVEQYKTCQDYEDNENTINQEICESLIIQGGKCKFTAGSGGSKGTCRTQALTCSDFRLNLFSTCSSITLSDSSKKCVYSNNACSITDKTCLDLYTLSSSIDEDEICGAAKTSSDKVCIGNPNKNGCVEASKEETHNNDETKCSDGNFIGKNALNKIILIIMVLLI